MDNELSDEQLKEMFCKQGIPIVDPNREPFGNERCPCGSDIRYDLCCGMKEGDP